MSKKFEEYLKKDSFSQEKREALKEHIVSIETVEQNKSPSDITNSYTPNPKDAGKQGRAGQEATIEQTKDSLAKYAQTSQHIPKEGEQEPEL
jgi:hypothetical protein